MKNLPDTNLSVPRHAAVARSTPAELARKWLRTSKWHMLLLFLSDYGRDIIERKYDAFTTDRAYENRPSGRFLIGTLVDWIVLRQDTHVALRQRLALAVEETTRAAAEFRRAGVRPVRAVSGPCGLARDLRLTWARLEAAGESPRDWLSLTGLDLDFSGDVIPAAGRMAQSAGVPMALHKQDLLDSAGLKERFAGQPVHLFLSMGLTVWLDPPDLEAFLRAVQALLEPGGLFVVDYFRRHSSSRYLDDFEMKARYLPDPVFEGALIKAGFALEVKRETANKVNVVCRARK